MSDFDSEDFAPVAVLEIDNEDLQILDSKARWNMFNTELKNIMGTKINESEMLKTLIYDKQNQKPSYDKCHSKSHGNAWGGGFDKSYTKRC